MSTSGRWHARIRMRTPLRYTEGADARTDRPAHVRAGSGLAYVETARGPRLLVVQDDANFLALVTLDADGIPVGVDALTLPPGPDGARTFDDLPGGRQNKRHKLDLEGVVVLEDEHGPVAMALGSGSSPARTRVVLARFTEDPPRIQVVDASALYDALRSHPLLDGAELNLEGAALTEPQVLRLFQRGNGAGGVDATFDIDAAGLLAHLVSGAPLPPIHDGRRWELGAQEGVRLTFTDACSRDGEIFVVAAAEASPNAYDDGEVVGCAFGVLGEALSPIEDETGALFVGKPEGLAFVPGDRRRAFVVVDMDDPDIPCVLLSLDVHPEGEEKRAADGDRGCSGGHLS